MTNTQWTLTKVSSVDCIRYIHSNGGVLNNSNSDAYVKNSNYVLPTLYLKTNVEIVQDGNDGSRSKPYNLSI